ncbi:MAG: hypothetical protein GF375_01015 [Candidatus Omnitrophica bacterium]|nr:hypothetical protein [Candidatus Omnitrophota bacterium]MBD3268718.1 hypothetical protein [Candidatus Omnitrophota bacterium]
MLDFFDTVLRIFLAFILGCVIGWEREKKKRRAGFRTHILVATGSCLIMLVSIYIYEMYEKSIAVDPSRIAAGVITGIGFLGAGTIIRSKEGVKGLTTAASVWVSSAIGLATGCGYFSAALVGTFIAYFSLSFLKKIEEGI